MIKGHTLIPLDNDNIVEVTYEAYLGSNDNDDPTEIIIKNVSYMPNKEEYDRIEQEILNQLQQAERTNI